MDYRDGMIVLGIILASVGIGLWSLPAALVFLGIALVLTGFLSPAPRQGG